MSRLAPTISQQSRTWHQAALSGVPEASFTAMWNDGQQSMGQTIEQVQSFHDWQYVAVNKECQLVSSCAPIVGQKPGGRSRRASLPLSQRLRSRYDQQRWNQTYGARFQSIAEDVEILDRHPLRDLLEYCNDEDTWADLAYELNLYLALTGCAYLWVIPSGLVLPSGLPMPAEIMVVPTQWVEELRERSTGKLAGWKITFEGQTSAQVLEPHEIIPFRFKSPLGKRAWTSPTQQTASWVDASSAIGNTRVAAMANRGNPSMMLEVDPERYGDFDNEAAMALANRISARARSIENHGMPLPLPPGIKPHPWSFKPTEMGFQESDDQLRDALFAARGFSKFVAGLTQDMNRADVEAALVQAAEFAINPRLAFIAGRLTEKLASRWDPSLLVWFPDVTPESWEREIEETKLDWQTGALTPDERREARGRDLLGHELSETGYVPSTMIPIMDEPEEPEDDEEPEDTLPDDEDEQDDDEN